MPTVIRSNLLPLAAITILAASNAYAAASTAVATAGVSRTGTGAVWSAWSADPSFTPQLTVNGALSMPGDWTPGAALPKSGSATYTGNVFGRENSKTYNGDVTGKANLTAFFDTPRIAGTFSDFKRTDGRGVGGGKDTAVSWGAAFGSTLSTPRNTNSVDKAWGQMSVNGMTGEVQARFNAGTSAIGGAWYLEKDSWGEKTIVSGTFAASKDGLVAPAAPVAPVKPVTVSAPVASGAFSSWAGTPPASVVMAPKNLVPTSYAASDSKQALYVGDYSAVVINKRNGDSASTVTGQANIAINFATLAIAGKVGNFSGNSDSANFLNSGAINLSANLDRTNTFQGSAVFVPNNAKVASASGAFTGFLTNVPTGSLAQGSVNVSNSDFALSGGFKAAAKTPIKR